ncbi:MAG: sigma-70 family RNA polymerase sigma factor [Acidimicrobiales bacterium]
MSYPDPQLRDSWLRFVDETAPFRADLFSFGLRLSSSPFDAEDLVHDALLRAFASIAFQDQGIDNLRSYLLRIMSNLWIDEQRRVRTDLSRDLDQIPADGDPVETTALLGDAAQQLARLSPQERVAVVLKDAFELTHGEIAGLLSTSEGSVRVALHRGRGKLRQPDHVETPNRVSRATVAAFVDAFEAYDMERLVDLMVDDAEAFVFPVGGGRGRTFHRDEGWLFGCFYHHDPRRAAEQDPFPRQLEIVDVAGEPVVLVSQDDGAGTALAEAWRFTDDGNDHLAGVKDYCFCPELLAHLAEVYEKPFLPRPYRF